MATINFEEYLTTEQFAVALGDGTQVDTVSIYCARGTIKGTRIGRAWFIHRDELERFKRERRGRGRPKRAV